MRSSTGTKLPPPSAVTSSTNATIAALAGPSFQDGRSAASVGSGPRNRAKRAAKAAILPAAEVSGFIAIAIPSVAGRQGQCESLLCECVPNELEPLVLRQRDRTAVAFALKLARRVFHIGLHEVADSLVYADQGPGALGLVVQIGRASCRERVCQYV